MEVPALQRLLLIEFHQEIEKLGQKFIPLYGECPLYGVSVLERFYCISYQINIHIMKPDKNRG